jgi:hypothetical protein
MKLDVLTYQTEANPEGVQPADWPARVLEVADNAAATPNASRMTAAEYVAYRAARQATYDAWYNGTFRPAMQAALQTAKDSVEPFLATLRDQAPAAISGNTTYLALTGATNAQNVAQISALTQQMNKVIQAMDRVARRMI